MPSCANETHGRQVCCTGQGCPSLFHSLGGVKGLSSLQVQDGSAVLAQLRSGGGPSQQTLHMVGSDAQGTAAVSLGKGFIRE